MHRDIYDSVSARLAELNRYLFLPGSYEGDIGKSTFVKVSIISGNAKNSDFRGTKASHGVIRFVAYWPNSDGPLTGLDIIGYLEENFNNQRLNLVQTFVGGSQDLGADPANGSLTRREFVVPYIYYGE
jgi:hypothetical protein